MKLGLRIALALALTQVPLRTTSSQNGPIKLGVIDCPVVRSLFRLLRSRQAFRSRWMRQTRLAA